MTTPTRRGGRPQSRSIEAFTLALWRNVKAEVILRDLSVEAACRALVRRGGIDLVKDGARLAAYRDARTLSKWYHEAELARKDPQCHPELVRRMAQIEAGFVTAKTRQLPSG